MASQFGIFIGASSLLIYAMAKLSRNVQYLANSRLRAWINTLGRSRVLSVFLGVVVAVALGSSGAVMTMLVGLANARVLPLESVFAVSLGASIGSTLIVYLFTFQISSYAWFILTAGVLVEGLSKTETLDHVGRCFAWLGLMFLSMSFLGDAGREFASAPLFHQALAYFRDRPLVTLVIATGLTTAIRSSAATLGLAMAFLSGEHAHIGDALPWILGANLGTGTTAVLASLKEGALGKQAAMGNLLFKGCGVLISLMFLGPLAILAAKLPGELPTQFALAHSIFNVAVALVFFPFLDWGVRVTKRLVPADTADNPFVFHYLDKATLDSPDLALAQAQREILRLADTVEKMVEASVDIFSHPSPHEVEKLKAMDQLVDYLNRGIRNYLTKLSQNEMTPEQVGTEFEYLIRTNDLENIGDIVDKNITELARKKNYKGYRFSEEGWMEIVEFHRGVMRCLRISTAYFTTRNRDLLVQVLQLYSEIEETTLDLTERHLNRLHKGVRESLDSSSIHLDLIGNLTRIAAISVNFARVFGTRRFMPGPEAFEK